jgi:hypothetical protein
MTKKPGLLIEKNPGFGILVPHSGRLWAMAGTIYDVISKQP